MTQPRWEGWAAGRDEAAEPRRRNQLGPGLNRFILSGRACAGLCPRMSQKRPWCQRRAGAPAGDTALPGLSPSPACPPGQMGPRGAPRALCPPWSTQPVSQHLAAALPAQPNPTQPARTPLCSQGPARLWSQPRDLRGWKWSSTTRSSSSASEQLKNTEKATVGRALDTCCCCLEQRCCREPGSAPCSSPFPGLGVTSSPAGRGLVAGYVPEGVFPWCGCRCPAAARERGSAGLLRARNAPVNNKQQRGVPAALGAGLGACSEPPCHNSLRGMGEQEIPAPIQPASTLSPRSSLWGNAAKPRGTEG